MRWVGTDGRGLWWSMAESGVWSVVAADEFGEADFRARDWTDEMPTADVCGSLRAYNLLPVPRREWGDLPMMWPPPVPGYAEPTPEVEL